MAYIPILIPTLPSGNVYNVDNLPFFAEEFVFFYTSPHKVSQVLYHVENQCYFTCHLFIWIFSRGEGGGGRKECLSCYYV